jgi:predicted RecB family nuclease
MSKKGSLRICKQGHRYYKSSDCPTCPFCEAERRPDTGFLALLAAPARRAFENAGITTLKKLSHHSKEEILQLHGMGPSSVPKLQQALKAKGLTFKSS